MKNHAPQPPVRHALVVAAFDTLRQEWRMLLESWGFRVEAASDISVAAQRILFRKRYSVIICDEVLPGGTAARLMRLMRGQGIGIPFIIARNGGSLGTGESLHCSLVPKPVTEAALWSALNRVTEGEVARVHPRQSAQIEGRQSRAKHPARQKAAGIAFAQEIDTGAPSHPTHRSAFI